LRLASGHRVLHLDRIDSTNAEARRLAEAGERGPLWVWADAQTGGRGRLGRHWVSEPGNLYATVLLTIAEGPAVAAQLGFVAAVAVHDAVTALRPWARPLIKWPNDLLLDGAKFCGLLAEIVATSPTTVALGCGINVAHAPTGTPYPVTALGADLKVESVLQELDASLSYRLQKWDEGRGFATIRQAWGERAIGIGGACTAELAGGDLRGTFRGLAGDGALLLETADGSTRTIHAGDVRFAAVEALRSGHR
jgi:BirA family transcriptional regulator, biotin operon repressor / biotin---[acetyl-CoA-carboxylase] ligase